MQIINVNIVNWSNFLALWHLNRIAALCEPFVQILKLCRVSRWLGEGSHSAVKFYDPTKSSFYVVLVTRIESQFASVGIEERRTQTATIQMNEEMQSNHLYSVDTQVFYQSSKLTISSKNVIIICEQSKVGNIYNWLKIFEPNFKIVCNNIIIDTVHN